MNGTVDDPRPLIVHLVYRFGIGGLENVIVNLINRLRVDAYRHSIVALTEITDFRDRITRSDVEYVALGKGPGHALHLYPRLWKYFRATAPTVLHTCNLAALEAVVPAFAAGVPIRVHAEHGWDLTDPDGSRTKYQLMRRAYRPFVSHYVAVSRQLTDYLTRRVGIGARHVSMILNGVDTEHFRRGEVPGPLPGFPFQSRHDWVVGSVGRMQHVKNPTLLARAFVRALSLEPAARRTMRLAMVGDGPLREACAAILENAGCGELAWIPGEGQDIAALMRRLDCFVLPSLAEGTSCTLQEAMASALPVVATDVGGNADLISHGADGTLVCSDDVDAMAGAILAYWRDPNLGRRHAAAARERAVSLFDVSAMVSAYDGLFTRLLRVGQLAHSHSA